MKHLVLVLLILNVKEIFSIYQISNSSQKVSDNPAIWTESGSFGSSLEEWALGHSSNRQERILRLPNTSGYYVSERLDNDLSSSNKDKWSPEYNGPVEKISFRPPQQNAPYQEYQNKPKPENGQRKEVSETDLYLLGAIEKLVYRVDFMEKRLKKTEELIHYIMAGTNKNTDPCPKNFTRAGQNCYHFGNTKTVDWKSASNLCKTKGATLAEMETIEENQDIVTYIQANAPYKGKDFWTGGLNPGLLWIWSNSARPVANDKKDQKPINSTALNYNPMDIKGNGRCLKLAYSPTLRTYSYQGADCAAKLYFICEIADKTLSNTIKRIAKELKLDDE